MKKHANKIATDVKLSINTFLNRLAPPRAAAKGVHGTIPLPPGYAYLIKSTVSVPELYPFLAEWLFTSRCPKNLAPKSITVFVDDDPSLMLQRTLESLKMPDGMAEASNNSSSIEEVYSQLYDLANRICKIHKEVQMPSYSFWADTGGLFSADENAQEVSNKWYIKQIHGAGNPMSIYRCFKLARFLDEAEKLKSPVKAPLTSATDLSEVTSYVLHSISNLYKNLGLRETMALIKELISLNIWREENNIFLATLQENVMDPSAVSHVESFFDGIIELSPFYTECGRHRYVRMAVLALPRWSGERAYPPEVICAPTSIPLNEAEALEKTCKKLMQGGFLSFYKAPPRKSEAERIQVT